MSNKPKLITKDLKSLEPDRAILYPPQNRCNELVDNNLRDFSEKNGTKTGQDFSLYDALSALCKEKKLC